LGADIHWFHGLFLLSELQGLGGEEMRETLTERCQFRMPADLKRALVEEANRQLLSESAFVRRALARELGLLEQTTIEQRQEKN
jgi:hypothetical protein